MLILISFFPSIWLTAWLQLRSTTVHVFQQRQRKIPGGNISRNTYSLEAATQSRPDEKPLPILGLYEEPWICLVLGDVSAENVAQRLPPRSGFEFE